MFADMLESLRRPNIQPKLWMKDTEMILGTKENLDQCIDECINSPVGAYGLDLETTGLDNRVFDGRTKDSIVGVCLSAHRDKGYYFPVGHQEGVEHNIPWRLMHPALERLLDPSVEAQPIFHNAGFDQEFLEFNEYKSGLGEERWDSFKWHDTYIIQYLLNPREKGGRGLKHLTNVHLEREMIELSDLMPDAPDKNYSKLDVSWEPCVWYAASDAMCTLGLWEVLYKKYSEAKEHTNSMYKLERMCLLSTRWMHRNRVYIDQDTALKYSQQGQKLWFDSLIEVYDGAKEILGRDITPNYVRVLKGSLKGDNKFNHMEVEGMSYKTRVDEARKESLRLYPDEKGVVTKAVTVLGKSVGTEEVEFPLTYDILSPQKLGLLFRELSVPGLKASEKSGQVVTSKDILEDVIKNAAEDFPFMAKVKTFRELGKAMGQYLIPFVEDVGPDGTLKPKFDQFGADTGRFSCKTNSKPWKVKDGGCRVPFQGIPATYDPNKPEAISKMRSCVSVRDDDWWLAAIDYAGVELRLVTNLSLEPKWIKAFFECSECGTAYPKELQEDGFAKAPPSNCTGCGSDKIGDLHTITAVAFYGEGAKNRDDWKALRGNAKGCNFALSYGGTGKAVQRTIGCSSEEADEKFKKFTSTYRELTKWWSKQHNFGRKHGYVKTGMGRVQPLPDIKSDDFRFKSKDERKAVNGPVQGTSADVTKLAMSFIYQETKKRGWQDKLMMVLTVHDEIVFEIHKSILKEAIDIISELMTRNKVIKRLGWQVPLLVDVELGKDWTVPFDEKDVIAGEAGDKIINAKYKCREVDCDGKTPRDPKPTSCMHCGSSNIYCDYTEEFIAKIKRQTEQIYADYGVNPDNIVKKKVVEEPVQKTHALPTFCVEELTEEIAKDLADWIKSQDGEYDVVYGGRKINALLE